MPIEIKELIVKASVRDEPNGVSQRESASGSPSSTDSSREEQIVKRCVEQVMDIIRIQNER